MQSEFRQRNANNRRNKKSVIFSSFFSTNLQLKTVYTLKPGLG